MCGVAISVVSQNLSALFRPAFTEGSYPTLLPPVGIKPNTALATAHQRRHMARKLRITERLSGICSKYSPLSIKVPTCTPWDILCGGLPCSDNPSKAQRKGKPPGQCRKRRAARYTYTQTTHLSVKSNPPGSASTTGFWSPCAWSLSRLPGGVRMLATPRDLG